MKNELGFAGSLARLFIRSKLTPVIGIFSIILGFAAVWITPKEEEPQISVPMIDIQVAAPGFEAEEVERKVAEPIERAVWGLKGVEYVYSTSRPHGALITVRFLVGESIETSLVKVHDKIMSLRQDLPSTIQTPVIRSYSIDDVPFLTVTFSSQKQSDFELRSLVAPLARELSSTPDLSRVDLLGGQKRSIRVIVDPAKLAQRGVSLLSVAAALRASDSLDASGKNWSSQEVFDIEVGARLRTAKDIEAIAVGQRSGSIVRIRDIARVIDGPEEVTRASVLLNRDRAKSEGDGEAIRSSRAVSLVFAKRSGTNVVSLSSSLMERIQIFSRTLPPEVSIAVTRNYGATAEEKSKELIEHLLLATLSVGLLIALVMGLRASIIVVIAIPVTLAVTLAIYYFLGYTLNRVTLFALIFSIGILVDDAIVVLENIERHLKLRASGSLVQAILKAVSEVGNPTILATFTVIASILPMAFVQGLMGPYMKPIPVGASLAMILSLFVAFVITPWASLRLFSKAKLHEDAEKKNSKLDALYEKTISKLLMTKRSSFIFMSSVLMLFLGASAFIYFKAVKVKMLPFDNKNEFQVFLDYPTSTPLQRSLDLSKDLSSRLLKDTDIEQVQIYVGEAAPFSFSGMVKHSFLRGSDYQADLQVVLKDKGDRSRSSHEIIQSLRSTIQNFSLEHMAISKVMEIPPGPPVLSTMLAEIYGPNRQSQRKAAEDLKEIFDEEPSIVDLDTSFRTGRMRLAYAFDPVKGGQFGLSASQVSQMGSFIFSETPMTTLEDLSSPEDIVVSLSVDPVARSSSAPFSNQLLNSFESGIVSADQVIESEKKKETISLYRKNLKPVTYVMSELAGSEESPVYAMLKLAPKISYPTQTADVPWDTQKPVIKWDGEWFITYEVFRDLGGAFALVMILIYVLVLGWFRSFSVPLIIMAPIPISLIGILPGHWLVGAYFTATSMIGFIAGAGIIVRNSIILVDFIEHQMKSGVDLKQAVVSAGVLRFRPMLLTAAAVVVGSAVMLADPIFQGLAISLMFGEIAATILSRFTVPILYFWLVGKSREHEIRSSDVMEENFISIARG